MKMKLGIAAALAHHPRLLLLDEATSGLDPIVRDEMLELLQEFVGDEEHAILFSSHITEDLEKVADYIVFLHKGRVVFPSRRTHCSMIGASSSAARRICPGLTGRILPGGEKRRV